jgi:hypothetical protein
MSDVSDQIVFNGVNAATGDYGLVLSQTELAHIAAGVEVEPDVRLLNELNERVSDNLAPQWGVDVNDLSQTGWGIIFSLEERDLVPGIKAALKPLIELRRNQVADHTSDDFKGRFLIADEGAGFRPGDDKYSFLARHEHPPSGPVRTNRLPYYLLIVASPEQIPFSFQYQMDVQFAVGRIHFDELDDYRIYAESIVLAETGSNLDLAPQATFFSVQNQDDRPTHRSHHELAIPLYQAMNGYRGWEVDLIGQEDARKQTLGELLTGDQAPSVLFTASHGIEFPADHPRQRRHQGALLCADWNGPFRHTGPVGDDLYFSADDLLNARLHGMVALHFACYGGGTPTRNEFNHLRTRTPETLASEAFVAGLPKKMLSHPQGGALAVIAHVERAWSDSFSTGAQEHTNTFEDAFKRLFEGYRVGFALDPFNLRYAEISTELTTALQPFKKLLDLQVEPEIKEMIQISSLWTTNNDARSYMVIGDPAVRVFDPARSTPTATKRSTVALPQDADWRNKEPAPVVMVHTSPVPADSDEAVAAETLPLRNDQQTAALPYDESYAINIGAVRQRIEEALRQIGDRVAGAVENLTTLTVETYVSDDIESVIVSRGTMNGVTLRARTYVDLDGDTKILVPTVGGDLDQELWSLHLQTVEQAQQQRRHMIELLARLSAELARIT